MKELSINPSIGLSIQEDHTDLLVITPFSAQATHVSFNTGFKNIEECFQKVADWVKENHATKFPISLSVSGGPVHFLITKSSPVPPNLLLKSFKLQLKQVINAEPANLFYHSLFKQERPDGVYEEFIVSCVDKDFREDLVQQARKNKLKVVSWDLSALCQAKVADYLWKQNGCADSSRFLIVLEWDHCQLFVSHPDGQLVTFSLSLGMSSFTDRLVQARAQIAEEGSTSIPNEDISFPSTDLEEIEKRRESANQAIHEVYLPFAQQVKTQLYATCNEYGISLPTHFSVVGPGSTLFGIRESLAKDFGLIALSLEPLCSSEQALALGATLKEKQFAHLNFLPRGPKEFWRVFSERVKNLKARLAHSDALSISSGIPFLNLRNLVVAGLLLVGLVAIPVLRYFGAVRELASVQEENKKLLTLKQEIEKAELREADYQKKVQIVKLAEPKRPHLSRAMKELISILPAEIKLKGVTLKGDNLIVKGSARSHVDVQAYLKAAQSLNYLSEPAPYWHASRSECDSL